MTRPLRILSVEDSAAEAETVRRQLEREGVAVEWLWAASVATAAATLAGSAVDLVLADSELPDGSGLDVLRLAAAADPPLPVILLASPSSEANAVECMKAGAADYVLKEGLLRLGAAVRSALERQRLLAEKARAENELRKLALAVAQSPVAVIVTAVNGAIEYVNPTFTAITGYSAAEAVGRNPRMLKSGQTPPEVFVDLWRTLLSGGTWRGEFLNRTKGGKLLWERATISGLRGPDGRVTHYVAVQEDVTGRKEAEQRLAETQRQLLQAQKMEAIGQLAAGVAHDFNNLLSVVYGYSELLLLPLAPDDPRRAQVEQITHAAERAAGLTRQLLAFSRRQVLEPRMLDLDALVADAEKMLRRLIGEDIELSYRAEPGGRVRVDPGQIEQVLLNLAINARDAMPGGGTLSIAVREVELDAAYAELHPPARPGRFMLLEVADTGVGMDRPTQARVFEPFFTTKEVGKGTGLGLATVYGIVKQHDGFVWVYSEPGVGTTFKVYLPVVEGASEERGAARAPIEPDSLGGTVLLVEDDPGLRQLAEEILQSRGCRVIAAGDGHQALALARDTAGAIDVLLTDVVMPRMSGRELAERLRAERPDMRVVFMSGYPHEAISRHGVLERGLRFLSKPFTTAALVRMVHEARRDAV